jgi:predicted transcriptional regulator
MPRFQSRLFNWIDHSVPAQWGRRARSWYEQMGNPVKQATETIKKNTTKAILYPVYILASATNLRSPIRNVPLLLKPVQSLVVWIDSSKIFAIDKSDRTNKKTTNKSVNTKSKSSKKSRNSNQNITKFEQLFLGHKNQSLSLNNSEKDFNRIQKLIKDAIAYFFGKKPHKNKLSSTAKNQLKTSVKNPNKNSSKKPIKNPQPWLAMADIFADDATAWPPMPSKNMAKNMAKSTVVEDVVKNRARNVEENNNLSHLELTSHQSLTHNKTVGKIITSSSQELQNSSIPPTQSSRPMYAWLETQATFLGYVSSPFVAVLNWLDRLIANVEKWIIRFWRQLVKLLFGL